MRGGVPNLLFHLVVLLTLVGVNGQNERTELKSVVERVFSRQRRFLLFPKGSNLKFTGSIAKNLLSKSPKGVGFTLEQALYYPVPTARIDVYPKRFRPRTTTTVAPNTSTAATYVWIPGTHWRYKAQHVARPKPFKLKPRIDNELALRPMQWSDVAQQNNTSPEQWRHWAKHKPSYKNWKHKQWSKWTTNAPKWSSYGKRWHQPIEDLELEQYRDWKYYHGHRDRRQLFDHFGGFSQLLGFDIKACILRAICESKRLLLPPGYSMFQDIVRLIFTIPTISGVEDAYSQTMHSGVKNCSQHFQKQCSWNIIAWIFAGQRH